MTSPERDRMAISRQDFTRVWGQQDVDAIDDIYAPDFRGHGFPVGRTFTRAQYRRTVELFQRVFPDCWIDLESMHADSEFVYASWRFYGTPAGVVASDQGGESALSFAGTGRHRHREGKVVEVWLDVEWSSIAPKLGRTYTSRLQRVFADGLRG
jgi:predicted ester cyclase